MWHATHEMTVPGLTKEAVWAAWADVDRWPKWDPDLEYAKLAGPFRAGSCFALRPKSGPTVRVEILRAEPQVGFTDLTRFPLACMFGIHDMVDTPKGLRLLITVRVEGPLAWLWRRLVAQKVADEAPAQLAALAAFAMRSREFEYVRRGA